MITLLDDGATEPERRRRADTRVVGENISTSRSPHRDGRPRLLRLGADDDVAVTRRLDWKHFEFGVGGCSWPALCFRDL
jgi:hypothetical protein